VDTEHCQELANQDLDRALRTDDPSMREEDVASAQIHALLAIASAVNRLAGALEVHNLRP
jgi:hypothetical protein